MNKQEMIDALQEVIDSLKDESDLYEVRFWYKSTGFQNRSVQADNSFDDFKLANTCAFNKIRDGWKRVEIKDVKNDLIVFNYDGTKIGDE